MLFGRQPPTSVVDERDVALCAQRVPGREAPRNTPSIVAGLVQESALVIPRPPRRRLARRLLTAQALVISAGGVTLAVVAVLVSPPLFRVHIRRALGPVSESVATHLDQAFSSALVIALGIAVGAAVVAALAISWILSSRLARPIEQLSDAADRLAHGDLSARGPHPSADDELADLTLAFNDMADALEHTEQTRRRLLADVAHELRTPLSTIEGYLEGLADGIVDPDQGTWATLQTATGRLRRLVDDVGLVSLAEEGQLEVHPDVTPIHSLIDTAIAATATALVDADLQLETDVDPDLPPVHVDPQRMAQVLENLLRNASRHTPAGGVVRVTTRAHDATVSIDVSDSGEGITGDQLPHVFERFYRGDPARRSDRGSGIGLTIAQAITRMHGGDITAYSDGPGRGATFTVTLPIAAARAKQPER